MAFIRITSGALKGKTIPIDHEEVVMGRSPENLIHLDDPSVSGRHCMIQRTERRFSLTDLKSTNGTRVNDVPVQSCRLRAKDTISVGSVDMIFDGDDIEEVSAPVVASTTPISRPNPAAIANADREAAAPATFAPKRNDHMIWVTLTIFLGLAAAGAFVWFVRNLFNS